MKTRLFALLTLLLAVTVLELGSFAILSLSAGEVTGYGRIRALQRSRLDTDPVELARADVTRRDLREHRIVRLPALHPFIGYVNDPTTHPKAGEPGYSREAAEYGFVLNRVDLFRPVAEDEVVIGVFGGSFAANLAAGGTRLRDYLLAHSESLGDASLTVYSFAIGGFKQPQQLMTLSYLLSLGLKLDVVINLDGFNEVALPAVTNVALGYSPFYPRGWPLMVGDLDQEQRRRAGELTFLRERRARRAIFFSRPPLRWSLTTGLIWKILDAPDSGSITELELSFQDAERSAGGEYQARGPRREYPSDEVMFDDLVAVWKRTSLLMEALCRGRGIEYLHFLQPNQYVPGSKPLSAREREIAWRDDHPYRAVVEQAYPRLVAAGEELRREGVRFFDLTGLFADNPDTLYLDACCHVNGRGNRVVARAITAAIDAELTEVRR